MTKYLFVTHGHMASGVKNTLEIIVGHCNNLTAIDAYVDSRNVVESIEAYFAKLSENDQLIMLSDIENGSANQLLFKHLDRPQTFLITGVNLPLLLQLVLSQKQELTEADIQNMVNEARTSLKLFKDTGKEEPESDEEFF